MPIDDTHYEYWRLALNGCRDAHDRKAAAEFCETVGLPIGFKKFKEIGVVARAAAAALQGSARSGQEAFFAGDLFHPIRAVLAEPAQGLFG